MANLSESRPFGDIPLRHAFPGAARFRAAVATVFC